MYYRGVRWLISLHPFFFTDAQLLLFLYIIIYVYELLSSASSPDELTALYNGNYMTLFSSSALQSYATLNE